MDSAGGALGAALVACGIPRLERAARSPTGRFNASLSAWIGISDEEIEKTLRLHNAVFQKMENDVLFDFTVECLKTEKSIGWFQGRMEFGLRALGNRSILGDARSRKMQSVMNLKVKFASHSGRLRRLFVANARRIILNSMSRRLTMLLVAAGQKELCREISPDVKGFDRLKEIRSTLPPSRMWTIRRAFKR